MPMTLRFQSCIAVKFYFLDISRVKEELKLFPTALCNKLPKQRLIWQYSPIAFNLFSRIFYFFRKPFCKKAPKHRLISLFSLIAFNLTSRILNFTTLIFSDIFTQRGIISTLIYTSFPEGFIKIPLIPQI